MLDALRKASERWFGRAIMAIVLGVIVVSFAIWGIGDVFSGFGADRLAQVGSQQISVQDFRTAYEQQLDQLQEQAKRPITSDEARAMGLDAQVLSSLVADAVLDQQAHALGLAMSDQQAENAILADPTFKGPDGKFDPQAFANLLQQNGLTEATFVEKQRRLELRREIADAVIGDMTVPRAMLNAVDQFRNETRSVDYFVLTAAAAGAVPAPSDKALQSFFNDRRAVWRAPEYRSLIVLSLEPANVADPNSVSDADARAVYQRQKASYGTPEKRQLLQATFPTQQDAEAAAARIKGGADFAAAAKAGKGSLVDLGVVERSGVFDPKIAQAAFSAPAGAVTAPIPSQFGWILVKVAKVEPSSVKPFAEVSASIKKEIALQRSSAKISDLRDRIEDQRTSGETLTQAAQSLGLKTQTIAAVDAQGLGKDGKPVPMPDKTALLQAAFASDVGMDNDVISTPDGGDLWFEVSNVDPAHDRPLAEVKPQAIAAWRQDQIAQRLEAKAASLVTKLNAGASVADVAKPFGGLVQTVTDVKRVGTTDLPAPVVAQVFDVPVGGSGSAAAAGGTRTVFKVNDSQTPPVDPSSAVNQAITENLREQMGDDVLSEYLNALQSQFGVSVNQTAMASVVSGDAQTQP